MGTQGRTPTRPTRPRKSRGRGIRSRIKASDLPAIAAALGIGVTELKETAKAVEERKND